MGGIGGGYNPYQNVDPRQSPNHNGNNHFSPQSPFNGNNNFSFGPITPNEPPIGHSSDKPTNIPVNVGPNIYVPPEITPKQEATQSISSINETDFYPELDAKPVPSNKPNFVDPDFDKICERLRKGL
jgi:hypothetical protein